MNEETQAFIDSYLTEAIATLTGDSDAEYEYSLDGGPWQDSGTFSKISAGPHEVTAKNKRVVV